MVLQQKSIIYRLLKYFKKYKANLIFAYVIMFCSTGLSLILPIIAQEIINNIGNINAINILVIILIIWGSILCQSISVYLFSIVGQKVTSDIREKAWKKALYCKIPYFDTAHSGEIASSILNGTLAITNFVSSELPTVVTGIISILASVIIMLFLDYTLTLIFLILIPFILLTIFPISRKVYSLSEMQQESLGEANSYFSEIISQIRLIKAYGAENHEENRGNNVIRQIYHFGKEAAKINAMLSPIMGGIITMLLLSIIGIGAYRVNMGFVSIGTLVAFFLYFYQAIEPIQSFGNFIVEIQDLKGSTSKLLELLDTESELFESGTSLQISGNIEFNNISFAYNKDQNILHDISFSADEGKRTAIVGESGSGKTTIVSILERFYVPLSGTIKIGSTLSQQVSLSSWRKAFGYVSQDSIIVSGTIKENILYGISENVKESDIIAAAKMADIYDFIMKLPQKFESKVGERGVLLSGGQKQRIAIARALIRNPKYLLLDEATANLDSSTEQKVQESIKRLLHGRTSIIIAHRLATVLDADKVIVLQNGKITGIGTHQQLIKLNQYYSDLVHQQFISNN